MTKTMQPQDEDGQYGILKQPNIKVVRFGDYELEPWYGNTAYFDPKTHQLGIYEGSTGSPSESYWLEKLYVCEYCFKYTDNLSDIQVHRVSCSLNRDLPVVGSLVYRDDDCPYIIRHIRGYQETLFCQNLCLFGKLFLDDKSVYYNVEQFDFYVLYGFDTNDISLVHSREPNFKPMGFFLKELVSWAGDNNLACICIFPQYQRMQLGSLLIEFLYEVARCTPSQYYSGPEFPLSPFGKVSYLRFWSRRIAYVLLNDLESEKSITLLDIANITGYRKEDIMLTLDYMKILQKSGLGVQILQGNILQWCKKNKIDPSQDARMLKEDCILL